MIVSLQRELINRRIPKSLKESRNRITIKMDIKALLKTLKKSQLFGDSSYGKEFDGLEVCSKNQSPYPRRILIRKGAIVDNLEFVYETNTSAHGGTGGSQNEFRLDQDEYIVKVTGKLGRFENEPLIESLAFTTNKGKVFSAGQPAPGTGYFEYKAEENYAICALFGRSDRYLNSIGFYTKKVGIDFRKDILGNGVE